MLISKQMLRATVAVADDESRPTLAKVYFHKEGKKSVAVATNSYILAKVEEETPDDTEFPVIPGMEGKKADEGFVDGVIAKKIARTLGTNKNLPALNYAKLEENAAITTDLAVTTQFRALSMEAAKDGGIKFPKYETIIPTTPPVASVSLDPKLLVKLLELFKGDTEIRIEIYDKPGKAKTAVKIVNANGSLNKVGLIMPMRG